MIILIPIGGVGKRFKNNGYKYPKSLIKVNNKEILFYLLDNLNINENIDYIYIPYNKEYIEYNFEEKLKTKYPQYEFKFLCLKKNTEGAAETVYIALNKLIFEKIRYPISFTDMKKDNDKPILCIDSDNYYLSDIINRWNGKNCVFTFIDKREDAKFSYITKNENNINKIVEKVKISDNACCGAYGFNSYYNLYKYCSKIIKNKIKVKNEYYISRVIQEMLNDNIKFSEENILNKNYFSLGTPKQVKDYEYSLLLDLDGTLVNTDNIYLKVWKDILKKWNINCDKSFFDTFIKGNSDLNFINYILPNIDNKDKKNISIIKDNLFIKYLNELNPNEYLFEGVLDFFEKNKNKIISIVTSCNRKAAEYILYKTGICNYIQLLIASEDCINHKPDPEPYNKAITKLKLDKNKCIIFEDSYSGYKSAVSSNVHKICLVINNKTSLDLINNNSYKIKSYINLNLDNILENNNDNNIERKVLIDELSYLPIIDIKNNNNNLKTGYICDIKSYKLVYNNSSENIVLKVSNLNNILSDIALKLDMYSNEEYFYKKISKIIVDINIPKCYGTYNNNNKYGIILEDLNKYNGIFNINLNNNVNLLLNIVNSITKVHTKFYFRKKEDLIDSMKILKTMDNILYYKTLIKERFNKFIRLNKLIIEDCNINILNKIYNNIDKLYKNTSKYPLSFCHGDLKSPNIFYKNNNIPYFLDWQYIHLNKGVSDIVFLLVESINFNKKIIDLVVNYYYLIINEKIKNYKYSEYIKDFKTSLCLFPFFVMVWFNSEDKDKLLDKVFPIKFMRKLKL